MTLTVGQALWWVSNYRGATGYQVTVTKLGRKWATLSNNDRISVRTLRGDGGEYASPGRCYLTEAIYTEEMLADAALAALLHEVRYGSRRPGVTAADIAEARRLLRVDEPAIEEED